MSRTMRRKNVISERYAARSNGQGYKVNGYYTTWDKYINTGNGHEGYELFRPMTEVEIIEEKLRLFGESKHSNAWGPNWWYKRTEARRVRHELKREVHKELTVPDYEGQYYPRGKYPWDCMYW